MMGRLLHETEPFCTFVFVYMSLCIFLFVFVLGFAGCYMRLLYTIRKAGGQIVRNLAFNLKRSTWRPRDYKKALMWTWVFLETERISSRVFIAILF